MQQESMPVNPIAPLPRTPEREALGAMGGYNYQIWQSVEAWLRLGDQEVLFLEGAEDIDQVNKDGTTTFQVKRTQEPISLNSKNTRDALKNFWNTCNGSPTRTIRFVYITTSSVATEQDADFGGLSGIAAWGKAAYDDASAEKLRTHLRKNLGTKHPLLGFLDSATTGELQKRLFRPFSWLTHQAGVEVIEEAVRNRVAELLVQFEQPRSASEKVKTALFEYCWKQVLKPEHLDRRLDSAALAKQVELATTHSVEVRFGSSASLVLAAMQLPSLQDRAANLALLQEEPPRPPVNLLRRPDLVAQVTNLVKQRSSVVLTGSVHKGKTTIAQVVARDAGLVASWTELSSRHPAAIAETFKFLAVTLDRPNAPDLLIFDDLDISASARRTYAPAMQQLVHRAKVAGKALLFTAQGQTESLEREVANLWGIELLSVYEMSQNEVALHCKHFGCPTDALADTWSRVIAAQTGGHPALVQVRLLELSSEGWPALSVAAFTTQSPATRNAKQLARDLLGSSATAAETEFALQAGEFTVPPTQAMLLNLAGLPPALPGPSTVLAKLTGRWIEELGTDRFRVTPILRGEVGSTWTPQQHKAVHAKVYDAIYTSSPLTSADAGALTFHAFISADGDRFLKSVVVTIGARSEVRNDILKHCGWALGLGTEENPNTEALGAALPSLRHLQFLVSELEDPARLNAFAVAWRKALGPYEPTVRWISQRMMYNMTVLTRQQGVSMDALIDAISSVASVEEPFKSQLVEGLASISGGNDLRNLGVPESATVFQTLLSLRAGGVRTREDLQYLTQWLALPTNKELAQEFDEMLEWSHVRELGGFVHTIWVSEANTTRPDWPGLLELLDELAKVCTAESLSRFGVEVARAKSIVLSEYVEDTGRAHAVLDEATATFGASPVLEEQRINLRGLAGDHVGVMNDWNALRSRFGPQSVIDPFAFRRAAISAAELGEFEKASELFDEGFLRRTGPLIETSVGLLVDAAYCSLKAGDKRRSSALLAKAVALLPAEAREDGNLKWEAIVQVANTVVQLTTNPATRRPDGELVNIAFGRASAASVSVDRATPGQARRVQLLEMQVAVTEACWTDAAKECLDAARTLSLCKDALIRLTALKALLLHELAVGPSSRFLDLVLSLTKAVVENHINSGQPAPSLPLDEALAGLLTLGLLLAPGSPASMLERWIHQAHSAGDSALHTLVKRLEAGYKMPLQEAVIEAASFRSGDKLVTFGAAVSVCRSDAVQARGFLLGAVRTSSATLDGLAPFMKPFVNLPVATYLAGRIKRQLLLPAQFIGPTLTVPAIAAVIRQVDGGKAGLQELLVVTSRAVGVDVSSAIALL